MSNEFSSLKDLPGPSYYLPPDADELDDGAADAAYARDAATLDTDSLMLLVAERFSDDPALRSLVEDTKRTPFRPGELRRVHISDAIRLGNALAALLADCMDEQIEMRLAVQEVA